MKRKHIPNSIRRNVLVEAGHRCAIPTCKATPIEIAHVIPVAKGGDNSQDNLIALCPTCHARYDKGEIDRKSIRAYKEQLKTLIHLSWATTLPRHSQQLTTPGRAIYNAAMQIPKPLDEQDFERKCTVLFGCILKDPGIDRHGRRGQKQFGVDIVGLRDGDGNQIVGIQCKLKGQGKKLTENEIRDELEKALHFSPSLSEYIIVTTAPKDAKLDRLELELCKDNPLGLRVSIWGWETLQDKINQHPEAIRAFAPLYTFFNDQPDKKLDEISKKQDDILLAFQSFSHTFEPIIDDSIIHDEVVSQINEYAALVRDQPSTALKLLESLLERHGSTASDHIRFRIVSNIAGCHLNLGNQEVAAKGFIEAFDLDPENPKAIANKALGFLINEDWDNLKSFAEANLPVHPDNARLAAFYIHSLIGDKTIHDPLEHVPEAVRSSEEVTIANVQWLMKRGNDGEWWEEAEAAYKVYRKNDEVLELYAGALLEQVIKQSVLVYGLELGEADQGNVQKAIKIYASLWSKICKNRTVREGEVSIPINLVSAYRIRGQLAEARKVGEQALDLFRPNEELKISLAAVFVAQQEFDRALELISDVKDYPEIIRMRFVIALETKDWRTITGLVSNKLDSFPKGERTFPAAIGVIAKAKLAPSEKRRSILEKHQNDFQGDACALIPLAQYCRLHGFIDFSDNYYAAAIKAVKSGDDRMDSRTSVAQEAMDREQYETAIDMLYGFVPVDRKSQALVLLAQALISLYPIRQQAIDFFEELPSHIRELHDFQKMEGVLLFNSGNPHDAIGPFSGAYEKRTCVENVTLLIRAHLLAGDKEAVKLLLSDPNLDKLPGSSLDRLHLCYFLIHIGLNERAIDLAYDALIEGDNSPDVVAKYISVVLKLSPQFKGRVYDEVAEGVWVRFTSQNNKTYRVIVGESADRLWGERGDLSNAFISQALGKKVNGQFEYTNASNTTEIWTISEIKPRWLQAFHYLGELLGERYPEIRDVAVLPIDIDNNNIQAILDKVRQHSQAFHNRATPYLKGEIPLSLAAWGVAGGPVAFANHLVSTGKSIQVSYGSESEYSEARLLIDSNDASGVVIDAFTAWRAAELGILPILRKCLGALLIPASEMTILQEMVQSRDDLSSQETMYLTYHEGKYLRQIITPEEQNDGLNKMKEFIAEIEKECRIEAVVIPDSLPDAVEQIIKSPAGDALFCAVLARERNMLLLCEDMVMRQFARFLLDVKGIWIHSVLFSAMENETLARNEYSDLLVELARRGHFHIPMSLKDMISVFERDESPDLTQLRILCRAFGSMTADRDLHVEVAVDFINRIWDDVGYEGERLTKPTDIVLSALLLNGNNNRKLWDALIYAKLNSAPRFYFAKWCEEHPIL